MRARVGVPLGFSRKRPIRCKNRSAYKDTKTTNETKTMIQTCGKYKINYTKHKGIYFILLPFKFNNCCFWVCWILIILVHASCQVSESYDNCSKYPLFYGAVLCGYIPVTCDYIPVSCGWIRKNSAGTDWGPCSRVCPGSAWLYSSFVQNFKKPSSTPSVVLVMVRFCVVIFRLCVIIFQFHVVRFRKILLAPIGVLAHGSAHN
jgi:hypothetical protein